MFSSEINMKQNFKAKNLDLYHSFTQVTKSYKLQDAFHVSSLLSCSYYIGM